MELARAIGGVIFLTIGIAFLLWFLRNLIRPRYNQARLFRERPVIILVAGFILTVESIQLHPVHDVLLGGIFGIALGFKLSK